MNGLGVFVVYILIQWAMAKSPHFLFLGQSNMVGDVNIDRFAKTMELLFTIEPDDQIIANLVSHLQTGFSSPPTPDIVYMFEASEILRLKNEGLLRISIMDPLSEVTCSFYQLDLAVDYGIPEEEGRVVASKAGLSPNAQCGLAFGPELMFGHKLKLSIPTFSIVKVAAGGSDIQTHWSKQRGRFWNEILENLVETIDTENQEWRAIVWYQGENDSFHIDRARAYFNELTKFIADIRQAMFDVQPNTFKNPTDIPVVIVGLGCWIAGSPMGPIVLDAQRLFVASSNNTVLVPTDDLSCHFHLDDASQLIIGDRIAIALNQLLASSVVTHPPTPRPTRFPTFAPSNLPVAAAPIPVSIFVPKPDPSAAPTHEPTLAPTPVPTPLPSSDPSSAPTPMPTRAPTPASTLTRPTMKPTRKPTVPPTRKPSKKPTIRPTFFAFT
jgi:hypothetical protein